MLTNAKFHHIGYAVKSIEKVRLFYESQGYSVSKTVVEPIQKVLVAYARKIGFPTIELLEPLDESSPIVNGLKKNGCAPYHVCYEVPDILLSIKAARQMGFIPLGQPKPGHGLDDALMVFLYNKEVGLIQIMQTK